MRAFGNDTFGDLSGTSPTATKDPSVPQYFRGTGPNVAEIRRRAFKAVRMVKIHLR